MADWLSLHQHGIALAKQGRFDEAVAYLHTALALRPDWAEAQSDLGIVLLNQGKLEEAAACLRHALSLKPDLVLAHNSLGIVLAKQDKLDEALASFRKALALRPDLAVVHHNLAGVLEKQGKLEEALASLREAIALVPNYAEAYSSMGFLLARQDRFSEARALLEKALAIRPDLAEAHHYLGGVLEKQGKVDEALACLRTALRLKPDYAEAYSSLGGLLCKQHKLDEALAVLLKALELKPDSAETHNNLGVVFEKQGKLDEAIASFRRATMHKPDFAEAYNNLGINLGKQDQFDEAFACVRQALVLKPDYAEAQHNLGWLYGQEGKLAEATACYHKALALQPDYPDALINLAVVLSRQGKPEEALKVCHQAVDLKPDNAEALYTRAFLRLVLGDLEGGWADYEWRWQSKEASGVVRLRPEWDGSPLAGRTILLYAEQGLGDTLQFIRYLPLVKQQGGTILAVCPKALMSLLANFPGVDGLLAQGTPLPRYDVCAPLMSLPRLLGTTLANIPADIPYLHADPVLVAQWRQRLSDYPGFKIGIVWHGNPKHARDRQRSVPLNVFTPLAQVKGVRLFSLQKGPGTEQLQNARLPIVDLDSRLDVATGPFLDTAAVMKNLDLVISVDTAAGHLAGALGVPVWLALTCEPDWRWLLDREDSPWYPTARLFRQKAFGNWEEVFQSMALEVERYLCSRN
jgi:tetratricopeptide (TPR) repeat protein